MKEVQNDSSGACTLIKRLNKSERSYITKKLSASKGNKLHQQLFEIVTKTNSFEEEEIKQLFKSSTKSANYTLIKSQLFELLLNYLSELNTTSSIELELIQKLKQATILSGKLLRQQAMKIVNSVLKEAEKQDFYAIQLKALEQIIELAIRLQDLDEIEKAVEKISVLIKKQETHLHLFNLTHQANYTFFKLSAKPEFKSLFEALKEKIVEPKDQSIKIQSAYHHLKGFVTMVYDCDYEKALYHFKKNLEIIGNNKEYINAHPQIYQTASMNAAICSQSINDEKGFWIALENANLITKSTDYEYADRLGNITILKQSFLQDRGKHQKSVELIENSGEELITNLNQMPDGVRLVLSINCVLSYSYCKEWKKALKWNNAILNEQIDVANDLVCFNKMINLIIHYELNNLDLIETLLPNIFRYLVARNYYNGSFKLVYDFFQNLTKDYSLEQEVKLLKTLNTEQQKLMGEATFNLQEVNQFVFDWSSEKITRIEK